MSANERRIAWSFGWAVSLGLLSWATDLLGMANVVTISVAVLAWLAVAGVLIGIIVIAAED